MSPTVLARAAPPDIDAAPRTDSDLWRRLFAVIDARDAPGFAALLADDAQFRFGNGPTIVGTAAITAAVADFFQAIGGCRHRLLAALGGGAAMACEGEVTYLRRDGSTITLPFVNVIDRRGTEISAYRIYIDNSTLFAAAA